MMRTIKIFCGGAIVALLIANCSLIALDETSTEAEASVMQGDPFHEANRLLLEHSYQESIEMYERVMKEKQSLALYHNLGIAYYLEGDNGRAVLNLEKALRLGFSSPGTREILSLLRNSEGISDPNYALLQRVARTMPDFVWFALVVVSFWLTLILGFYVYIFVRPIPVYRDAAIFCLIVFLISVFGCMGLNRDGDYGVMIAEKNGLKIVPTDESDVFLTLNGGEMARKLDATNDYLFVETSSGVRGWLSKQDFALIR